MDQADFRNLMAGVPAPVTVVTTMADGVPRGATVSSFASLSLAPALVSIALSEASSLIPALRMNRRFAINLLAHDQADVARRFAAPVADRFEGIDWMPHNDLPRLAGVARYLECVIESDVKGGDHAAFFGRVLCCWTNEAPPLIYHARRYGTHSSYLDQGVQAAAG